MERISNFKRLVALAESGLGFVIIKKPTENVVEFQFGDFGNPNLPIQTGPSYIKRLDGKYDYKFIPKKSGLFVLSVECLPEMLEDCFNFIITKVLQFPENLSEHFTGEKHIVDLTLPVEKQFDITTESVEIDAKDVKSFSFFS